MSPAAALPERAVLPLRAVLLAWPAMLAATVALLLGRLTPLVSPLLWALVLGVAVANLAWAGSGALRHTGAGSRTLLRLGIVAFGALLSWEALRGMGMAGLLIIVATVVVVFVGTCWLGDRMGLPRGLVTLIAAGFSICGAAAIAAVEGNVRRRDEDVGIALALVTLCGTAMIVVVPVLGSLLGLSAEQIGVWAGASIHEVAQVVAAASVAGGTAALVAAMAIKLGRVALLFVAHWGAILRERHAERAEQASAGERGARVLRGAVGDEGARVLRGAVLPWFLVGFVVMAAVSSTGLLPAGVLEAIRQVGVWLLAAGMFGLGLGIDFRKVFPMPWAVVGLALASTALAALLPLGLILTLM
ncbi:YeiH family protein [Ornithinimicrobium sp. Y1847]|uniref:YeiH family protein n=1 Tax=unclassified Ornithinimicrobium TaxID=2615080 RepID=UPI003B6840FB